MRLLIASLMLIAAQSHASPYFRIIDPSHPHPVVGALVDPRDPGNSQATTLLPIITHSPKDGCLIPQLCETWSPLAIGGAINAGKATFIVAPLFGAAPWAQAAVQAMFPNVEFQKNPAVELSFGPAWEYDQASNRGYFRIYSGLRLNF